MNIWHEHFLLVIINRPNKRIKIANKIWDRDLRSSKYVYNLYHSQQLANKWKKTKFHRMQHF